MHRGIKTHLFKPKTHQGGLHQRREHIKQHWNGWEYLWQWWCAHVHAGWQAVCVGDMYGFRRHANMSSWYTNTSENVRTRWIKSKMKNTPYQLGTEWRCWWRGIDTSEMSMYLCCGMCEVQSWAPQIKRLPLDGLRMQMSIEGMSVNCERPKMLTWDVVTQCGQCRRHWIVKGYCCWA